MRNDDDQLVYSRTLQLFTGADNLSFVSVINPFANELHFDLSSGKQGQAKAELIDQFGKTVKRRSLALQEGVNSFSFDNTALLQSGIYILRVELDGMAIYKKVLKQQP
jgi:hypothetical protein